MTDRKTPPPLPPPVPGRPGSPRLDDMRPGFDQPEDRMRTAGRAAARPPQGGLPKRPPSSDPNRPPIPRQSRSEPEPRRGSLLMGLLIGLITLISLAGAGAAYLAINPPIDLMRQQIVAQVKAKTGRDLTIAGPVSFTVWPAVALSMRDVTLSAPPAMGGAPAVVMAGLEARVRLLPLLQRQIAVDQLVLRAPVFDLRIDATGRKSWDFAELAPLPLVQLAQAPLPKPTPGLPDAVKDFVENASDPDNPSPQVKARLARLEELTLGDVRIENGTVLYADDRTGFETQISAIETRIALKSLASPLDAQGKLTFEGEAIQFDVKLASLKALLEDRPAKLAVAIKGQPVDLTYDGTVTSRASVDLDGALTVKAGSARALARWLGTELPPAEGFGALSVSGKLRTTDKTASLQDANLSLDGMTATGTVSVETGGARPHIIANLKAGELDLNRYTLAAGTAAAAKPKVRPAIKPVTGTGTAPVKSIEDLINGAAGGPQVKGYAKRAGWNEERIDLGGLGVLDADAKISVSKLLFRDIKVGASAFNVALKAKVLRLTFDDVQLYEGRGRGVISIDATGAAPVVGANLSVEGIAAQPLLRDAADFEMVAGAGRLTVAIGAQGQSEAQLVQTANGKADFTFTNGSIVGYNIPGLLRGLSQGKFSGLDKVTSEKTDFSELAATFTITNGVANNQDLRLIGPLIRVTGAGQIQLPAQAVDYVVKPKLVASLQGQGSGDALAGLEVPVRIQGPWAKLAFTPDVGAVLRDPKALDAAKEIGRQFKEGGGGKAIGDALKGFLGKGTGGSAAGAPADGSGGQPAAKPNARQLLDKFLKPQ
jgi:AsmA protein